MIFNNFFKNWRFPGILARPFKMEITEGRQK